MHECTQYLAASLKKPCVSTHFSLGMYYESWNQSMEISQEYINAETTILGDINIDYKLRHTVDFDRIKEFERDFQLKQYINTPTRITRRNSSILDMVFSNMEHIESTGVLNYQVSDHAPVFITKKKQTIKKSTYMTRGRTYKNYICENFQQRILEDHRWADYWDHSNDVDTMWQIMYDIIIDAADITCPFVNMKIMDGNPDWFSHEILEELYLKDELFREYQATKTEVTWEQYVLQRNRVKTLIKKGKENFIKDHIEQDSGNPKKFWRKVNNLTGLGKERSNSTLTKLINDLGETISGKDAIEYINNYYASAGYDLLNKFDIPWHPNLAMFGDYDGLSFQSVTQYEVCKLIKEINISKSSAYTDISSRLLKDAFTVLIRELTHLFNTSIEYGIFPKDWGLAEVTPIPKSGDLSNVKNWRPISQIKLPGKLLERLIHTQLSIYFEKILNENQHGFRTCKSTGTALFDVLRDLFQNWNERKYSSCIFIDYSKAFDTIDYIILLKKLEIYGLDIKSLNFMKSYLFNRHQRINIRNDYSDYTKLRCGVPQGSILGPLLFIIYTNDLFLETLPEENIYMYADDTLSLNTGKTQLQAVQNSQQCFDKIITWCNLNRLTINKSKTKHLCVSRTKDLLNITILKDTEPLGNVDTYDYLGFTLDNHLTMLAYVDKIIKKINFKLYTMNIMRRYISERTALLVYKVMIMPHYDYVDFVIDSATKYKTNKLERLHKRAIRTIEYRLDMENRKTLDDLYSRYNLTSLYQRRVEHLLLFMYKISKDATKNIEFQRPKIELRSKNKVKFKFKFTNITKVQNSPFYRGTFLWDQLPNELQLEPKIHVFKNGVRALINADKVVLNRK